MLESAIRGVGTIPCRVAFSRGMQVLPDRVCWLLSSNKAQTTPDLANRSVITRLRKQLPDHKFAAYAEGDLLVHVGKKCDYYLSCLLAVLSEWHKAGKPRTEETRHDFREWCQTLDWIVQNVLKLPPLLDGHQNEQKRIKSAPELVTTLHLSSGRQRLGKDCAQPNSPICAAKGWRFTMSPERRRR